MCQVAILITKSCLGPARKLGPQPSISGNMKDAVPSQQTTAVSEACNAGLRLLDYLYMLVRNHRPELQHQAFQLSVLLHLTQHVF